MSSCETEVRIINKEDLYSKDLERFLYSYEQNKKKDNGGYGNTDNTDTGAARMQSEDKTDRKYTEGECSYFCTTWDVGMMQSASDVMAQGGVIQDWVLQNAGDAFAQNYFNAYPNNIFLTVIFAGIKDIAVHFGFADGYFATIVVGVISVDISIVFTVLTVWKLTDSRKLTVLL